MVAVSEGRNVPASYIVKTQLLCLWTVPAMGLFLLIAFLIFPGFFPPMSPTMSAQQVADFYREHASEVRFSMVTFNIFGIMLLPFYSVIVVQMQRTATPSKVLGYCYLTAAQIIRHFMEVRSGPRWLRVFADVWIVTLWGTIVGIYLW